MADLADIRAKRVIGPYHLIPEAGYNLWIVTRPDGKPLPKELVGRWTSIDAFKQVYTSVHGEDETLNGQ